MSGSTGRIYYGWWMVIVCMIFMGVGAGASIYLYSVVAAAIETEFPSSRLLLMTGATMLFVVGGLAGPKVGNLIDRYPVKWVLIWGSVILGAGFLVIAAAQSIWQIIVAYGLFIAVGNGVLGTIAGATLLNRWFLKHRGLAMGIAGLGTQLGGLTIPPLTAGLIGAFDWRIAMVILGVGIIVIMPLILYLFVREGPDDDQDDLPASGRRAPGKLIAEDRGAFWRLLREPNFLMLAFAVGGTSLVNVAILSNLSIFAIDMGEPLTKSALLVSVLSITGMVSSPLVGRFCDIWNIRIVAMLMFLLSMGAALIYMSAANYGMLLVATLLQGIAGGSIVPLWMSLVSRVYDSHMYGLAMGSTTLVVFLLIAVAPILSGQIHDMTGSYRLLFLTLVVVMALATFFAWRIRLPAERPLQL